MSGREPATAKRSRVRHQGARLHCRTGQSSMLEKIARRGATFRVTIVVIIFPLTPRGQLQIEAGYKKSSDEGNSGRGCPSTANRRRSAIHYRPRSSKHISSDPRFPMNPGLANLRADARLRAVLFGNTVASGDADSLAVCMLCGARRIR